MSLSPKPRFAALPAMLFAVGLGLAMWHGHALWRMPVPASPVDLEPSVDLNLALDDHRTGSAPATGAALEARRERIRQELLAEIARDDAHAARQKEHTLQMLAAGVAMMLVGLAQLWLMRRMATRYT